MAFEITPDDITIVLLKRDQTRSNEELKELHDTLDIEEIEEAALAYDSDDDQLSAALSEIEDQLIAGDHLPAPKFCLPPGSTIT